MFGSCTENGSTAVRLTFPAGEPGAGLNAMVLASGAIALGLDPDREAALKMALAGESAEAMARHESDDSGELSVELGFEPGAGRITITAAERTAFTTSCDGESTVWSEPELVAPARQIVAEFAGSTFLQPILPRVFARVAFGASASLEAVTCSAILGDQLAAAAAGSVSEPRLRVRVRGDSESLEAAVRAAPAERLFSALTDAWPATAETFGAGSGATLLLQADLPAA